MSDNIRSILRNILRVLLGAALLYLMLGFAPLITDLMMNRGHNHRQSIGCISNMKQLGLALVQYSEDYDNNLPAYSGTGNAKTWRESIYSYIKNPAVYQCSSDDRSYNNTAIDDLPKSYSANTELFPASVSTSAKRPYAPETIVLVDTRGYSGPEWNITSLTFLPTSGRTLYTHTGRHIFYKHPNGTINCLFPDGHAKALKPMATLTLVNYWTRNNLPFTGQDLTNAQAILNGAKSD